MIARIIRMIRLAMKLQVSNYHKFEELSPDISCNNLGISQRS